jgi:hypothetical protein
VDLRVAAAARPQRDLPGAERPMRAVLLVSRARDEELALVGRLLEATGIPVVRLDAESVALTGVVIDPDRTDAEAVGAAQGAIRIHGQWVWPTVSWLRHFSPQAMPASRGAARRAFVAESWQALADQLTCVSTTAIASHQPGLLDQLVAARLLGVAIPRTVVTTEPAQAAELIHSPQVIIKALHRHYVEATAGLLTMVFPEVVDTASVSRIPSGPPIVVQEHIDHQLEVRAYYVQSHVTAAFAITKSGPGQPWLDPSGVSAELIETEPEVTRAVTALAETLGLTYGAFDFLISAGVPVFLEVNAAGDWLWLERKVGSAPVTTAVVRMLQSMHELCVGSGPTTSDRRSRNLNLVTFLSCGVALPPIDNDEDAL